MTQLEDLTLSDLAILTDVLRNAAAEAEAAGRRRAAPALSPTPKKRSKTTPPAGIEISTLDGLTEREAAKQLGAPTGASSYYVGVIRQARKRAARRPPRFAVCQAGVQMRLGLRCDLAAVPGEPWCRSHHPDPPPMAAPEPSQRELGWLRQQELAWRPDGTVLRVLYEQADAFHELAAELRWQREHIQHLEQLELSATRPAWMNLQQAAAYAGRPVSNLRDGLSKGHLKGSRPHGTKVWSVRPTAVDAWLSQETSGPARRPVRGR